MDFTKNNVLITDDQNKIDEANAKNIPVIGFEHDGIKLSARYIVLDEEALDDAFLENANVSYEDNDDARIHIKRTGVGVKGNDISGCNL